MKYDYNDGPCMRQPLGQTAMATQMPMQPGVFAPGLSFQQPAQMTQQMPMFPSPLIGTVFPTGLPLGPATAPMPMPTPQAPVTVPGLAAAGAGPLGAQQAPEVLRNVEFIPGFLRTQIGRRVRVEFLIGTGAMVDRSGTLLAVGASYIIIQPVETDDIMLCDLYAIKFVTVFY